MTEYESWGVDAVRPGWVRVHQRVADDLRAAGAEVERARVPGEHGRPMHFPVVRTWAMDLWGQLWRFLPDDEQREGRRHTAEHLEGRRECLVATVRRCSGLDEAGAREVMQAAFAAYLLGGPDAVVALGRAA